jgi:hypothetical protein
MNGTEFWVQAEPKELWHMETDDNCEVMLCGVVISVDLKSSKVQASPGPRRCPDCWMEAEKLRRIRGFAPTVR